MLAAGARPKPSTITRWRSARCCPTRARSAHGHSSLPPRQREVVFLRYFADLDEASIASALGIRRGTVAATLHRVHARMRVALDEGGLEP